MVNPDVRSQLPPSEESLQDNSYPPCSLTTEKTLLNFSAALPGSGRSKVIAECWGLSVGPGAWLVGGGNPWRFGSEGEAREAIRRAKDPNHNPGAWACMHFNILPVKL
jgi:hypothetical protein